MAEEAAVGRRITMKSLRERKKSETRRRLAVAAVELLAEEGEEGVTIAAIADRAGVSTRTFHNYFQKREDAFYHFIEVITSQWKEKLAELPPEDGPIRNIRDILLDMIDPSNGFIMSPANFIQLADNITVLLGSVERACAKDLVRDLETDLYDRTDGSMSRLEIKVLFPALLAATGVALEMSHEEGADPVDYVTQAFDFFESRFSANH
ncbi:TetR/AcrR family transcriptional regulator [Dietzia timorensis]|nr:TetR/AcrR family transcriptional regulator [Dietzia timorensis]